MFEYDSCHYDITNGEERKIANEDGSAIGVSVIRSSNIEG